MSDPITCDDLNETVEHYTKQLGYRLDMIVPADSPTAAVLSKNGETIRLIRSSEFQVPSSKLRTDSDSELGTLDSELTSGSEWIKGRAGMEYRDLIPGRLGGRVIASHIRLTTGGEVADYVHYHKVTFQMIYSKRGRIKVVYEDQGEPFWLATGDCVLQPPEIRHRVLECTAGAEVIEVSMPAVHETWVEHEIELPTGQNLPERDFGGQRFVRHIGSCGPWKPSEFDGFEARDTRISEATGGLADVRVLRSNPDVKAARKMKHVGEILFYFVINGELRIGVAGFGEQKLAAGDSIVVPTGAEFSLQSDGDTEILSVCV